MMKKEMVGFDDFLQENKDQLIDQWFDLILQSYPPEAARIFKGEKDHFANPVGSSILTALGGLYPCLDPAAAADEAQGHIEMIIRIRAVQDCRPSQAVEFLAGIKKLVRERSKNYLVENPFFVQSFLDFAARVDQLMLMAMDAYMKNRELIYQLRLDETKSSIFQLLKTNDMILESHEAIGGSSPGEERCREVRE